MNHGNGGWGGGGRVCTSNPDHKVGMIAQRILKLPSLISLGALEFQCPNILTYLMNVSCMDDMKKVNCPLYMVVIYAPPPTIPTSPMHGETSHVQVKDRVCSIVTLLHGCSSCIFDALCLEKMQYLCYQSKYIHVYTPD